MDFFGREQLIKQSGDGFCVNAITLWTPAKIPTALWVDGADSKSILCREGTNYIRQPSDKSGNNRHPIQPVEAYQPEYDAANKRIILSKSKYFDMTTHANDLLRNIPHISIYMVLKTEDLIGTGEANQNILYYSDGDQTWNTKLAIRYREAFQRMYAGVRREDSGTCNEFRIDEPYNTNTNILNVNINYITGNGAIYLNGSEAAAESNLFPAGGNTSDTDSLEARLFGRGEQAGIDGCVYEILAVINESVVIHQKIEGYLAHKWELIDNLPANHPYKNVRPRC